MEKPDYEARLSYCAMPCTLDGVEAVIMGARNPFGTVSRRDNGLGADWSWQAIARVMAKGGAFRS